MKYIEEIQKGMDLLYSHPKTVFIGQAVKYPGTAVTHQLKHYSPDRLIEMPVAEEMQMGISLGLAIAGHIPVSIYPRFDFLLLATNQLVNHLNRWKDMSGNNPKVIIKTVVGSSYPLDPRHQHKNDYTDAFRLMLNNMRVENLLYPHKIYDAYKRSLYEDGSFLLIEHADLYNLEYY